MFDRMESVELFPAMIYTTEPHPLWLTFFRLFQDTCLGTELIQTVSVAATVLDGERMIYTTPR